MAEPETREVDALQKKLEREARAGGYHLNPDAEFTRALVEGLATNVGRYGYQACPCRLAAGEREADLDIICPCDYRDADLGEFGACYCALYVSREIAEGKAEAQTVPERRPAKKEDRPQYRRAEVPAGGVAVWRCRVCGYLCGREAPPETCPICKASKDRFESFAFPAG
ncbi:MAG: ferredoxin-thioredoxin reductase catalytic domain-containing protein [Candidatus Zixiibacteriota bacterium]|jgi:ferredoxin-thioredoxin reductase catalytic subunit/rubredoxin